MNKMSRYVVPASLVWALSLGGCAYLGGQADGGQAQAKAEPVAAGSVDASGAKPGSTVAKAAEPAAPAAPAQAPGEAALAEGIKAYQAGQYKQAEARLTASLKAGLTDKADLVAVHKHLAFVYCLSKRDSQCAAEFKAAKAADADFALSKSEAGHPMWAKTYKRALGLK